MSSRPDILVAVILVAVTLVAVRAQDDRAGLVVVLECIFHRRGRILTITLDSSKDESTVELKKIFNFP